MWHPSHTFGSLHSKFGTPLTPLPLWNQKLSHLSHSWLVGIKNWHLSHFWLFGVKIWQTSHTFGSLESKFSTPLTLLALWNQKLASFLHFWLFAQISKASP